MEDLSNLELIEKMIKKLESIPTQPEHWNNTVKAEIYYGVREACQIACLLRQELKQL
jgi:hypothetical protein